MFIYRDEFLKKMHKKGKSKKDLAYERYKLAKEKEEEKSTQSLAEKLAQERKLRLEKIREKEELRRLSEKNAPKVKTETIQDNTPQDSDSKIVRGKTILTEEEIEARKQKALEDKKNKSARDLLKERIKEIEDQISNTKYNKKTQHAVGLMKAQVANLKTKLAGGSGKGGKQEDGYAVRKTGDGTVVLLGFPSTGKSTLLNKITGAESEVGAYEFTTLSVIPGMLQHKHAKIQILDVPGIVEGAASGSGRGKEVLQVVRNADFILVIIDPLKPEQYDIILKEVYETHVRVNQKKPDIKIHKQSKDGIRIGRTVETPRLDDETIKGILKEFRILNAEVLIRDDISPDQLIDSLEGNKAYVPAVKIVSKADLITPEMKKEIDKKIKPDLYVSAHTSINIDELKEILFNKMNFIRIYLKEINKKADLEEPMIMKKGETLKDLCSKLHKDFVEKFQFAKIWGPSAKFDEQKFMKLTHKLADGDVVELHTK